MKKQTKIEKGHKHTLSTLNDLKEVDIFSPSQKKQFIKLNSHHKRDESQQALAAIRVQKNNYMSKVKPKPEIKNQNKDK